MMLYTLWRNHELLGDLVVPFRTSGPETIAGMLRPTAAFADIGRLTQARVRALNGTRVYLVQRTGHEESGPVALRPMTPDQALGIPTQQQLELRDERGSTVPVAMIMIDPFEIPHGVGEFSDACRAVGLTGSGWSILARVQSENDALRSLTTRWSCRVALAPAPLRITVSEGQAGRTAQSDGDLRAQRSLSTAQDVAKQTARGISGTTMTSGSWLHFDPESLPK